MRTAVYPGSFDPLTNGHLDVIKRAQSFFDKLYVLVAKSFDKKPLFSIEERIKLIQDSISSFNENIEVVEWSGLTVDFAKKHEAGCIIRGVRSSVDFRMEQTLANINYELSPDCETLLLCCRPEFRDVSSRLVKEIAMYDERSRNLDKFVPVNVQKALLEKMKKIRNDEK